MRIHLRACCLTQFGCTVVSIRLLNLLFTCHVCIKNPELHRCDCMMQVQLVAPGAMPKLGKGGTLASRQAILHRCARPFRFGSTRSGSICPQTSSAS